jgi:hypothetical protein
MNPEELADYFKRMAQMLEGFMATRNSFAEKLAKELCDYVSKNHPDKKPVQLPEELIKRAKQYALVAYECFAAVTQTQENNDPYDRKEPIYKITSDEEIEQHLREAKHDFPEEDWEGIKKVMLEDYESMRAYELFEKGIHDKVKEVLVEYFEDTILELKSEYLKLLEDLTYILVASSFFQDVHKYLE